MDNGGYDQRYMNRKLMHDMIKNGSLLPKDDSRLQSLTTQLTSMHKQQLNQIEEILYRESFFLTRNLDVERIIGQNQTSL